MYQDIFMKKMVNFRKMRAPLADHMNAYRFLINTNQTHFTGFE